ncbi:MAG TPA: Rrf2 family transcriptional regulator [Arcobacter sp.]|jgi:Rrf2 family protein|nr:Rrf2 family transcriptional regulator [Arcobacter sp.]
MLLTKKTEYALLSLISIARSDTPINVDVLSRDLNIPKPYLAKILQSFSKKDILKSYKGINGGFVLNIDPQELTILKITSISEEKVPSVFECSGSESDCPSDRASMCHLWPILNNLQGKIDNFLDSLTLKDIM